MKLSSESFWVLNNAFGFAYSTICVCSIIFCVVDDDLRLFYTCNIVCSGMLAIIMGAYRFLQDNMRYERHQNMPTVARASDKGVLTKHLVCYPVCIFTTIAGWHFILAYTVRDVWDDGSSAANILYLLGCLAPLFATIQAFVWMGTFYRKLCEHHQIEKRDLQGISFFAIIFCFWSLLMGFWCFEIYDKIHSTCELAQTGWLTLVIIHGVDLLLCFFCLSMAWTSYAWYAGYVFIPLTQLGKLVFFCITTASSWKKNYTCSDDTIHVVSLIVQCFSLLVWGFIPFFTIIYMLIRNFIALETFRLKIFLRKTLRRKIGRTIDHGLEQLFHDPDIERTVWRYLGNPTHAWFDLFPKYYPKYCPLFHRHCSRCCCYKSLRDLDEAWEPKYPLEVFEIDVNELLDRRNDQAEAEQEKSRPPGSGRAGSMQKANRMQQH